MDSLRIKRIAIKATLYVLLSIGALFMIFPFIWMILSSFKTSFEMMQIPLTFFPKVWTLENYKLVFEKLPVFRAFFNSLIVSSSITFLVLFTSSITGFIFAKMRFKGKELFFYYILLSLMVPIHLIIIPLYMVITKFGIVDTYMGLILPFAISGFGIYLLRSFIKGIPSELIEAAKIDGASDIRIYLNIILPLVKPILSVLAILIFLWSWDEFLWPLVVVSSNELKTVPLVLASFTMAEASYPAPSMAAASIVIIPVLIVYAFFQRNFVKGISLTGIKG
ncbi:MAG: carbohydrate ABC transporter permease [Actinobacteria bacterium]|nr:carbohydrate ABC transporter permease [Actinomycetota bacterium]